MYELSKTDPSLGERIHQILVDAKVETPMRKTEKAFSVQDGGFNERRLTGLFKEIWETMGLDLTDDSLQDTPKRMAKMFVNELYYGLDYSLFPKCTVVQNKMRYDEFVTCSDIQVMSSCEHHGATIHGKATISYKPGEYVLGLSKFNRIVDFFCRRPQIQERLTEQIYHALKCILQTDDIAIKIEADHFCVKSRGAQDNSVTTTVRLGGVFLNPTARMEFLSAAYSRT